MEQRIISVVEDPSWGRATLFGTDPESKQQLRKKSVAVKVSCTEKTISEVGVQNQEVQEQPVKDQQAHVEIKIDRYYLPYLQSSLIATILEDSVTELRILAECNNEIRISRTLSDIGMLRSLKYGVEESSAKDELEGFNLRNLGCADNKIKKLELDRQYVTNVLVSMYQDLTISGSFKVLSHYINQINEREVYRLIIEEDEAKNRLLRRDLIKQLRQQRNHIKSAIYDCNCTIEELKNNVEDSTLFSEARNRYVDNWQQSRTEQNTQSIQDKLFVQEDYIEYYKTRNHHEHRVHSEVELLGNIIINETLDQVETWMNKYDKDMEDIDLQIQIKKNYFQNMRDRRIFFEEMIEQHDQMMKDWIHFKEERDKARRYQALMTKSAIIVQAWWRGLLVRRQLGPYKVAKKKGKKK